MEMQGEERKPKRELPEVMWRPDPAAVEKTQIELFARGLRAKGFPVGNTFDSLYSWSIAEPELFWRAVSEFCGVSFSTPPEQIFQNAEGSPRGRWFEGARLNFSENLIAHGIDSDRVALTFWNERGRQGVVTYAELNRQVAALATAFKEIGVAKGDVIAAFVPNLPEAIVGMLATAALGAVWTSSSPEFSEQGVLDRFLQVNPKVFVTADGYLFKGQHRDSLAKANRIAEQLDTVEQVVLLEYAGQARPQKTIGGKPVRYFRDLIKQEPVDDFSFEQVEADHPVYIMYSSGTTGAPKCMVHGAVGTLIEHKKELMLHLDLTSEDTIFYRTTTGWMMWNWMVSSLSVGAKLSLFDGDLNSDMIFVMAEQEGVTVFGSAAGHVQVLKNHRKVPRDHWDLGKIRSFLSTGSTLWPDLFDYVAEAIGPVQIASISGGTDLIGCFALGCPTLPVHRGELQARSLGYAVDVFNSQGEPVRGEVGELVCTAPFPSMPVQFMNDPDGGKYHAAYFDSFPGVWCHGDAAVLHADTGGMEVLGRSDDTLNPGGERFGPAVITNVVDAMEGVLGSTAVAVRSGNEERVVLFVKLEEGASCDNAFVERVRAGMINPRYRPHYVLPVSDFPFTRSGKLSNRAVRAAIGGDLVPNESALANPEVLAEYVKYRDQGIFDFDRQDAGS